MDLVTQIINDLIDQNSSLNGALLKTKVLAKRLENEELLNWVNYEISGYPNDSQLPEYRKNIWNALKGNMLNGRMKYTDIEIPTAGLNKELEKILRYTNFKESVTSLENLSEQSNTLTSPIRSEVMAYIQENWRNMGNPYLNLISCYKIISKSNILSILSNVRNKLLDFMLALEKEFGTETEIQDLRVKNQEITRLVNHTIINNSGEGNTINTGNNNEFNISNSIEKGNINSLKEKLKQNKISEQNIKEIAEIIDQDNHNEETKTFGDKTKKWMKKMLSKSIDGTWKVNIAIAGNILTEIFKQYLGF